MCEQIIHYLSQTRFFAALEKDQLKEVAAQMRDQHYRKGELIFSRGDQGDQVFLIMKGRVRFSVLNSEGRELTFSHSVDGELFGEIAVLDGSPRSANAVAINDTHVKSLSRSRFKTLQQSFPVLSSSIIELLCERMRVLSDHTEGISLFSINIRLARFLLLEIERKDNIDSKIELEITQAELAMLLGASRPKVNVALSALEASGAITREGSSIRWDKALLEQAGSYC
ncbi:Crp/Fnr family transcriptional regulator [Granulosicoccus sp.]|jgi:CRP-like cAMP-binding protein|nr:Crp/Fnr family transcriptional regulator [Granulosicoccus sp.]MDB4224086.1 Crp/Fnr family transcriptional regulator [Granulosicoccus sp.]